MADVENEKPRTYMVIDNDINEALVYNFGQKDAYDAGQVAKVSYLHDILIFVI